MALAEDLDAVLAESFVADLGGVDTSELKVRRTEGQRVETKVSYLRRLTQARIDIVQAEIKRRADGGGEDDLSYLVDRLPEILSDRVRAPGPGRMPAGLTPDLDDDEDLTAELDAVSGLTIGDLPDLPTDELEATVDRLGELEGKLSGQRRALFGVIDALQNEIAERYEQPGVGGAE